MGNNYLSYHAGTEGKMTKENVQGLENHTFRKTNDVYKNHGNEQIHKEMTKYNIDYLKDNKSLTEQVEEQIEMRFKGKRGMNKKSVVAREIVVQPSSNHFEGLDINQKLEIIERFTKDSLEWVSDEFGEDNVLGYSVHMDESNPHVHIPLIPMTKDGRVSQKDFFKGPAHFKTQHKGYREHMNSLGWDFENENKNEGYKGVKMSEYKGNAKAIEKARAELTEAVRMLKDDDKLRMKAMEEVVADFKSDAYVMDVVATSVRGEVKNNIENEEMPHLRNELKNELSVLQEQVYDKTEELEKKKEEIEKREQLVVAREKDVTKRESRLQAIIDKAQDKWNQGKANIAEAKKIKEESQEGLKAVKKVTKFHKNMSAVLRTLSDPSIVDDYVKFMRNTTVKSPMGLNVPVVKEKVLERKFDNVTASEKAKVKRVVRNAVEDDGPEL